MMSEARSRNIAVCVRAEIGMFRCEVLEDKKAFSQVGDTESDFELRI